MGANDGLAGGTTLALPSWGGSRVPRTRERKPPATRFCGTCGYGFARDAADECPMCARFEQPRIEFALPRPTNPVRQASPGARLAVDASAAPNERPTPAEYRAVLAARRSATAAGDDQGGGNAAMVIRTRALREASGPRSVAPLPPPAGASPAAAEKARRKSGPTPPPPRKTGKTVSAVAPAHTALPAPDATQVVGPVAERKHAGSARREVKWRRGLWVVVVLTGSALIGASVPLVMSLMR